MTLLRWVVGASPFLAMTSVTLLDAGLSIVSKAAMTKGMSNFVFIVYTNVLAFVVLLPFAVFRRKGAPITLPILFGFVLLSLLGSMAQICAFTGINYSSPTLGSAVGNLIPLFTYFLATITRMEKLDLRSSAGLAISLGAGVAVLGTTITTLYQGPAILMSSYFHGIQSQESYWVLGGLLFAAASVLLSLWLILMTVLVREFPEQETIILFVRFFSIIITGIFALFMESNPKAWKLTDDIEIAAILYSALCEEVISTVIRAWCLKEKGITYTVMFQPLGIVFSVVMAIVFLRETLHIGSLLGGIVVTLGFYAVMWGKAKEKGVILDNRADVPESCSVEAPLLLNDEVHRPI